MSLEGAELSAPFGLQLIEERLNSDQRLGPQLKQSHACVPRNTLVFDDPRREEDLEMPAHGRLGHAGRVGEFAGTMRSLAEELDHAPSGWISERLKHIH
jgi:hypothetical protein